MKYGAFTLGQTEALINKLGGLEIVARILRDEVKAVVLAVVANTVLRFAGCVTYRAIENHDPQTYFHTRKGLYAWDGLTSRVLAKAGRTSVPAIEGKCYDLTQNAYDHEIVAELGEGYAFESESELCAHIAGLIDRQSNGEEGVLLNNGYTNIFYLRGCVVGVYWRAGARDWSVRGWGLDDGFWVAGSRVFSRN